MSALITRARAAAGVVGLTILGASAAPVSASELFGPDEVVQYGDLDLNTRTGAETLYARLQLAADHICRPTDSIELTRQAVARRCQNELVARSVASVRSPQLAAVYESHRSNHRPV
jgi:UrcA family protein